MKLFNLTKQNIYSAFDVFRNSSKKGIHLHRKGSYFQNLLREKKEVAILNFKGTAAINKLSRELCSYVLKHLSRESAELVKGYYSKLGSMIKEYDLQAEDLDYLLKATPDARCEFVKGCKEGEERLRRLEGFRKVLLAASEGSFPDRFEQEIESYALNLESLMTALGYTALFRSLELDPTLGPGWVEKEGLPSPNLIKLAKALKEGRYLVPSIGEAFQSRSKEQRDGSFDPESAVSIEVDSEELFLPERRFNELLMRLPGGVQEPLPNALRKEPMKGLPERVFTLDSFVGRGIERGISMRAHASGSAPLTLAAMQFVSSRGEKPELFDEEELVKLAGLLCAIYECGDYHSPAETAAGICHFHQESKGEKIYHSKRKESLEEISPKTYLGLAVGFLSRVVAEEKLESFLHVSQAALEQVREKPLKVRMKKPSFFGRLGETIGKVVRWRAQLFAPKG